MKNRRQNHGAAATPTAPRCFVATPTKPMHEQFDNANLPDDRYASFKAGDGTTVIYDRENTDAWIQSDLTRSID